jgi:hypothetical protein
MARWVKACLGFMLVTAACGGGRQPEAAAPREAGTATLTVENLGFADATIYALGPTGNRIRVGDVNGNSTRHLELASYLVRGGESLRFVADPIGSPRGPVTDELFVAPGDTVVLRIPPR